MFLLFHHIQIFVDVPVERFPFLLEKPTWLDNNRSELDMKLVDHLESRTNLVFETTSTYLLETSYHVSKYSY